MDIVIIIDTTSYDLQLKLFDTSRHSVWEFLILMVIPKQGSFSISVSILNTKNVTLI